MNLVTGATGIVGSHVVLNLLQKNKQVVACKQKNSDLSKVEELFSFYADDYKRLFEKIKWVDVDICNVFSIEDALDGITTVYHCAGFVSFNKRDRKKLERINTTGTQNVVDACLHKNIHALCHVSSVATMNNMDYTKVLTEEVFWKTSGKESDYAISKYGAERHVWRGMEEGLNAVIVNPGIILSPGFWQQSSSRLFSLAHAGNKFYTNGVAGYVAATDVASVMIELVEKNMFGQRYVLIENNYTYYNILSHIQTNFKQTAPAIHTPEFFLKTLSVLEHVITFFTGKNPRLNAALIHAAYNKQLYSNQKVKTALGLEFRPVYHVIEEICRLYMGKNAKNKPSV